jgi:hypothetical protein
MCYRLCHAGNYGTNSKTWGVAHDDNLRHTVSFLK